MFGAHFFGQLFLGHTRFQSLADDGSDNGKFRLKAVILSLDFRIFESLFLKTREWNELNLSVVIHDECITYTLSFCQELNSRNCDVYLLLGSFLRLFDEGVNQDCALIVKAVKDAYFSVASNPEFIKII
ncbi:MAG: hypothetical protein UY48_C0050G0001 [Candidatus Gottesmanbacteria bacterium GW2011_GWB1_49_7]|uniref:Uncharacterized protein n=1 Tax=Candidatus Gottesmanbacteria bacterium GW2011_GWB1_49_7 TaxID=1618448 RepID=A0A0G1Y508_9BACT|nr:MAG: hypothetical protein UY48_C0050G0001 [Candidatus Gottesmanbacteria bacterium GW2011_GWB1_49_7]